MNATRTAVLWMVDDDPAELDIIRFVCEKVRFTGRFETFTSGQAALERLEENWGDQALRPDVILLDVNMPRMGGMTVLRRLRENPQWATLPVVMFSTSAHERDSAKFAGATDYLVKPDMLLDTVEAIRAVVARYCTPPEMGN